MRIATLIKKASNLSGKQSASQFLREHRAYLSGFHRLLPILVAYDSGKLFPTQCLQQIVTLLSLEQDPELSVEEIDRETGEITVRPSQAKLEKLAEKAPVGKYFCVLYADKGTEISETFRAETYGEAERKAHVKLYRNEDSTYVNIIHDGIETKVFRDAAMKQLLNPTIGGRQVTSRSGVASLANVPNAKQTRAHFSRG